MRASNDTLAFVRESALLLLHSLKILLEKTDWNLTFITDIWVITTSRPTFWILDMPFNQSIVILELPWICKSTTLPSIVILSRVVRDDDSTQFFDWVPKLREINYMKWIFTLQRDNFLLHISLDFPSKHHWSNNMLSFYLSPVVWSFVVESLLFILYIFHKNIESRKKLVVELKDSFEICSHFKNNIWLNKLLLGRTCKEK